MCIAGLVVNSKHLLPTVLHNEQVLWKPNAGSRLTGSGYVDYEYVSFRDYITKQNDTNLN